MGKGMNKTKTVGWQRKKRRPSIKGAFRFFKARPVWRLSLLVLIIILISWQAPRLAVVSNTVQSDIDNFLDTLLRLFGWGLVVIAAGIAVIIWLLTADMKAIMRRWRELLAGISLGLAIFGFLAFFVDNNSDILVKATLGGTFGKWVINSPDFWGGVRVFLLALLTFILLAPQLFMRGLRLLAKGIQQLPVILQQAGHGIAAGINRIRREIRARRAASAIKSAALAQMPEQESIPQQDIMEANIAEIMPDTSLQTDNPIQEPVTTSGGDSWDKLRDTADKLGKTYQKAAAISTTSGWKLPPVDILDEPQKGEFSEADVEQRARIIENALASYGVEAKVVQTNIGPVVTQFGLEPGWDRKYKDIKEKDTDGNVTVHQEEISRSRVKVDRITSLSNDLALALATPSIRIEAPIPGKAMIGIEVPNTVADMVTLKRVVESASFQKLSHKTNLPLALGKGSGGGEVLCDLSKMPHLLIAGATGSGKTVCLDSVILSLLMVNTPRDLQFILIDPKRVELTSFNSIPHLAVPVIVESARAVEILNWANREMDDRYRRFAASGARNIQSYNKNNEENPMPYLVIVIDELADLMMAKAQEVEISICRLAQLARATGIHLVVATQRPSVDVITGLIKANFPSRISFAVASQVDSRTILDSVGAEKLLGRGDMLYHPVDAAKPIRAQGCFVSDQEIERVVYFWNSQQPPEGHHPIIQDLNAALASATAATEPKKAPSDPLMEEARQLARSHGRISTSFLQRRLGVGYPRAARLLDLLREEENEADDFDEQKEENPKDTL